MGDMATVRYGPSEGFQGVVQSVSEASLWISSQVQHGDQAVPILKFSRYLVTTTPPPIHITWRSSTGFDVVVGDTLRVVRGPMCGEVGLVESVSPYENLVTLKIEKCGMVCVFLWLLLLDVLMGRRYTSIKHLFNFVFMNQAARWTTVFALWSARQYGRLEARKKENGVHCDPLGL